MQPSYQRLLATVPSPLAQFPSPLTRHDREDLLHELEVVGLMELGGEVARSKLRKVGKREQWVNRTVGSLPEPLATIVSTTHPCLYPLIPTCLNRSVSRSSPVSATFLSVWRKAQTMESTTSLS